jgi:hypothetical protein
MLEITIGNDNLKSKAQTKNNATKKYCGIKDLEGKM